MSTWHQDQYRQALFSTSQWTVVCDPPNRLMTLTHCDTEAMATRIAKRDGPYTYVLRPELVNGLVAFGQP